MQEYKTRQRRLLTEYLSQHPDEKLSVKQIAAALAGEGISLSAVYRNLSALENSGMVKKCGIKGGREVFYQYMDIQQCREHLHLSCKKCGKIFHLNTKDSDAFVNVIAGSEGFVVDKVKTIIYGTCRECQE